MIFRPFPVCILGGFLVLVSCTLNAQPNAPLTRERVYLHTDRDRYMTGDTVWFKAYLSTAGLSREASTALHVELFGPDGTLLQRNEYPVLNGGVAIGQFPLPDSSSGGLYTLRAYTEWMRNFDDGFFYHFTFPVYQSSFPKPNTKKAYRPLVKRMDIQFLPEGGEIIQNVFTKVAFRVTDGSDHPLAVSGVVVDDLDTPVISFQSVHDGMGYFNFTPWTGRSYWAIVATPDGEKRIALPHAQPDGVILNAKIMRRGVAFVLRADSGSRYLGDKMTVTATVNGQAVFRSVMVLRPDSLEVNGFIPSPPLANGIMTLTVLDGRGTPLAERLVFVRSGSLTIPATVQLDTLSIKPKGLNEWTLSVPDTAMMELSVSVTDAENLTPRVDRPTILSGLLLSGDLKGHVYHPSWYFKDDADSTREDLDLVMLTHGWRRFCYSTTGEVNPVATLRYSDSNYLSFRGRLLDESRKKLAKGTPLNVFLQGSDSTRKAMSVSLDSESTFAMNNLVFFDSAFIYFQVKKVGFGGKYLHFDWLTDSFPPFVREPGEGASFSYGNDDSSFIRNDDRQAELFAGLRRLQKAKELGEIVITSHKKTVMEDMDQRHSTGLFSGGNGFRFDLVHGSHEAQAYTDIIGYLQSRVPGLIIGGGYPNYTITRRGYIPDFFLDEQSVIVASIVAIPVSDIAYVKVIEPPFVLASGGGGGGAIAVYTKRLDDFADLGGGMNRYKVQGYTPSRQFYVPVYEASDTAEMAKPDYRITLDWDPYLRAGQAKDRVSIRFFNNDSCHLFRLVAEGRDDNGRLLHLDEIIGLPNDNQ